MKSILRILVMLLSASLIIIALSACSEPMAVDTVHDFILNLPQAKTGSDVFVIDLSNPDHYHFLTSGWHIPDGVIVPFSRFLWTSDLVSSIDLYAAKLEDKELIITIRPYLFEGAPPTTIIVDINDTEIGRIQLKDEWRTYRLLVPEKQIQLGRNVMTLRQGQVFKPSDVMLHSMDQRSLGASYSYVVFRSEQPPRPPDLYTLQQTLGAKNFIWGGKQRHVLFSPAPSRFSWKLCLPSRPVLSFGAGLLPENFDPNGAAARFEIDLTDEAGKEHVLFKTTIKPPRRVLEMGWRQFSRTLDDYAGQTVTISFLTDSNEDESGVINSGSWLEPTILNRHSDHNVIFLLIGAYFNSETPPLGTGLEKLLFSAVQSAPLDPIELKVETFAGLPVEFLTLLRSEGWPIGYFGTGQSAINHQYKPFARSLDAIFTYGSDTEESYELIKTDCQDWIRALENRRFILMFDPRGLDSDSEIDRATAISFVDWLLENRFDQDSVIVVYNSDEMKPVWVSSPGRLTVKMGANKSWQSVINELERVLMLPNKR
ncbi:hypothetical protein JW823_05315 [bacterium]|nr:hypothetical protein [candidate division CSSED10-310 bacterium]